MSAISPTIGTVEGKAHGSPTEVSSLGAVGYLNTVPLIAGLDRLAMIRLHCDVPASQVSLVESGKVDLGLCSVIDLVHSRIPLQVVPVGMLGCVGKTMTVRLFSRVPIEQITRVHCDSDSHTSVTLLEIILRERGGPEVELVTFDTGDVVAGVNGSLDNVEAILLIGDKVVTSGISGDFLEHQLDLGEAWYEMTGLPFVFATWLCPVEMEPEQLARVRSAAQILDRMRRRNGLRLPQLATRYASRYGWPEDKARRYLVDLLRYDLDKEALEGLRRFIDLAGGSSDSIRLLEWA